MLQDPRAGSRRPVPDELDAFLDCLALLLARRWLRDQRQQPEQHPKEQPEQSEAQRPEDARNPHPKHDP